MIVHIFSHELEVLEYSRDELPSPEKIGERVRGDLAIMGLEPWPYVGVEAFTRGNTTLVFATPARVYVSPVFAVLF